MQFMADFVARFKTKSQFARLSGQFPNEVGRHCRDVRYVVGGGDPRTTTTEGTGLIAPPFGIYRLVRELDPERAKPYPMPDKADFVLDPLSTPRENSQRINAVIEDIHRNQIVNNMYTTKAELDGIVNEVNSAYGNADQDDQDDPLRDEKPEWLRLQGLHM